MTCVHISYHVSEFAESGIVVCTYFGGLTAEAAQMLVNCQHANGNRMYELSVENDDGTVEMLTPDEADSWLTKLALESEDEISKFKSQA